MKEDKIKISLVIPVLNEEESLPFLKEELDLLLHRLEDYEFEFILVDDGSSDQSQAVIKSFSREEAYHYIIFSRNFGKESAMLGGLHYASGQIIGLMDADLQHSPQMIPQMLDALVHEGYDVAAAKRSKRIPQNKTYNVLAEWFYKLINRFSDNVQIEEGSQDFRLMKRPVVDALLTLEERKRFSKGLFAWVGFKTKWFEVEDLSRVAGKSKFNFFSSFGYAMDGIISFSIVPLRLSFLLGGVIALIGIIYALYIILETLLYGGDVPGYPSLMSGILIIGGLILFSLGVIGEYLARIYEEAKKRPHFVVKEYSRK